MASTRGEDRVAIALALAVVLAFLGTTLPPAAANPLWMDEVLAVWTARQPGPSGIWSALQQGAEFSPPLYPLLIQGLMRLGDAPLLLRLPSVIACLLVGAAAFVLARRRFPVPVACLALTVTLTGILLLYAVQIRSYACVAACFAWSVVLWDRLPERDRSPGRVLGIAALLALAVAMHFYAVLLVAALGLMEALRTVRQRRIRWPLWGALAVAGLSVLCWLPIILAARAFNQADTAAPAFYARPTAEALADAYDTVLTGDGVLFLSPAMLVAGALLARLLARKPVRLPADDFAIATLVVCALPLLVFAFALGITHAFRDRYVIAAALGFGLLAARLVGAHPRAPAIACILMALVFGNFLQRGDGVRVGYRRAVINLVQSAPADLPVATGVALRAFEILENRDPATGPPLAYVAAPGIEASPDPTNDHQIRRWATIRPNLPIVPLDAYLRAHADFVLLTDDSSTDLLPAELDARGYRRAVIAQHRVARLWRVSCPLGAPCAGGRQTALP